MLVLSRKAQQQIQIGDGIVVTILAIKGRTVRVGIDAPRDVRVMRSELCGDEGAPRLEFQRDAAEFGRYATEAKEPQFADDDSNTDDCRRFRRLPGRNRLRRVAVQVVELATSHA